MGRRSSPYPRRTFAVAGGSLVEKLGLVALPPADPQPVRHTMREPIATAESEIRTNGLLRILPSHLNVSSKLTQH
ncbi:hypothetical protein GCM10011492_19280 [Flexivirga endophytica]|uniref:Uncharacterized protein n=1 Tax=Flexivirga endophytica TaxID=1849103 RepID=A0A916T2B1_9MICO|nr:hypothetical protein GCM10011492_19280 [Flexivirga endophytica]GHB50157.1 hypothetical protein GCM10008112_18550 [Flexivirga endophytica]